MSARSFRVRAFALVALCAALTAPTARAQISTMSGYWREPGGSVVRVASCGEKLCAWIITVGDGKHPDTDIHNPDPKLRARPLCELRIGESFTVTDAQHADGGRIYDPRSGHTYRGSMTAVGDALEMRGYIGIRLFGRTETWVRVRRPPKACLVRDDPVPGGSVKTRSSAKYGYAIESKGPLPLRYSPL